MRANLVYAAANRADEFLKSTMIAPAFYFYLFGILLFLLLFSKKLIRKVIVFFSSGVIAGMAFRSAHLLVNSDVIGLGSAMTGLFLLALLVPFYIFLYFRYERKFVGFFFSFFLVIADGLWVCKFILETRAKHLFHFSFLDGYVNSILYPLIGYLSIYLLLILLFFLLRYGYSYFFKNEEKEFSCV